MSFIITTDSNSETPLSVIDQFNVPFVTMPYTYKNDEYFYDLGRNTDKRAFFADLRAGEMPATSLLPPAFYEEFFRPILAAGNDVLHIAFSSALSATYQSILAARQTLEEEFPDRHITLVDTLCMSLGVALLVHRALEMQQQGHDEASIVAWLEGNKMRMQHWFTVGDLNYLKRGGRVSSTAAFMGTMLNVKPILYITQEGRLQPAEKVTGRKKALRTLADKAIANAQDSEDFILAILHADCEEDALLVRDLVLEKRSFRDCWVQCIGPVIGSHTGPDTVGIVFIGGKRLF